MKYRIIFIDEEKVAINKFKSALKLSGFSENFELITHYPESTIEEMIMVIQNIKADAIITDYLLNEKKTDIQYNVAYTGSMLIEKILSQREEFPCFIITSVDDHATDESQDVNLVYVKNRELSLNNSQDIATRVNFFKRILKQIVHYKKRIESKSIRLEYLIHKRDKEDLSHDEELEIIDLDTFLEKSLDSYSCIPHELKKTTNTGRLISLLEKTDKLLDKFKSDDKGN